MNYVVRKTVLRTQKKTDFVVYRYVSEAVLHVCSAAGTDSLVCPSMIKVKGMFSSLELVFVMQMLSFAER
jgi:hypothetical protein